VLQLEVRVQPLERLAQVQPLKGVLPLLQVVVPRMAHSLQAFNDLTFSLRLAA